MEKTAVVEVYWRPGCPYCMSLRRGLSRAGVPTREINIWADPAAAAFVRSVAHGNETVPTVVVAGRAMVNPSTREVLAATGAMPDQPGARSRPFHAGAGYGLLAAARATATVTGGVALTVVVAAGLYLSGRLDGPALFGGSALAETLIVSAAAAALAWWGVTRKRGRAPARKPPPHDNAGSAADTGDI